MRAVDIIQTVGLLSRPRCPTCLEKDIRKEYGERELWLMDGAVSRGRGGRRAVNTKIQELRAAMAEDIENVYAQYGNDWRTNEETTWTDGYMFLIWNPRFEEVIIYEGSRMLKTSTSNMTATKGSAMQYFLKEPTDIEYEPMDMSIPSTKYGR